MQITRATRQGSKLVIGLVGESGGGKTFTAILLALGMLQHESLANKGTGRLLVIDTENGRSSLYADDEEIKALAPDGFDTLRLDAPFSPSRFTEAIAAGEAAGYHVIILDSVSHEWVSEGGVIEMAANGKSKSDFANWNVPKQRHNAFFQRMLQSKAHVICCFRAKEKYKQVKNAEGKQDVVSVGLKPVQDQMMIYDMTLSFMIEETLPRHIKVPKQLKAMFPQDRPIGAPQGRMLAEWVDGGEPLDEQREELKALCKAAAAHGMESLKKWFETLDAQEKTLIKPYLDTEGKSLAREADEAAAPPEGKGTEMTSLIMDDGTGEEALEAPTFGK